MLGAVELGNYGALGAFVLFAVLVIERIFAYFKGKGEREARSQTKKMIEELHTWHDMRDEDGVPLWYVRKSLEAAITTLGTNLGRLADAIEGMSRSQERIVTGQKEIVASLGRVEGGVKELGRRAGGAGGL
jgi:hypothetical protein